MLSSPSSLFSGLHISEAILKKVSGLLYKNQFMPSHTPFRCFCIFVHEILSTYFSNFTLWGHTTIMKILGFGELFKMG